MLESLAHHLPFSWTRLVRRLDALLHFVLRTPLEKRLVRAVCRGQADRVARLLDLGRDTWPIDTPLAPPAPWEAEARSALSVAHAGRTLLHLAAQHGQVAVVEALLGRGAKVDAISHLGLTPAMLAACRGHAAVVALLAGHGARLDRTLPSMSTYWDDYVGPTVRDQLERVTGVAYRGDEYSQVRAQRLGQRLAGADLAAARGRL